MRNSRPMVSKKSQPVRTFSRLKLYAAVLAASQWMVSGPVWAAPEGGEVVGGEGIIQQAGVETIINQATERMAIDWRSFDVAANERVEFIQPSSSSVALNRVLSNRGSEILGRIDANGQVILVNANGVVFGKDSVVNVGGMIASGLNIDPASFINGDFALNSIEGAEGKVINYGIINAATGGSVTLVGEQVQNDGLISAKLGAVNLVAGKAAVLTFDPTGMVGVRVTEAVVQDELGVDAAVINNGSINAEGGRVLLSASVSEDVFSNAVNNAGMNKSTSVVVHDDGSFTLGAGADVINTGNISTSVNQGNAGQVVLLGDNVTHSGSITANTSSGTGGSVELHSTDTTLLTENSRISAQASTQGEGGDIKVLGNKVALLDQAEVNASGANGGGQVLIGGDKTGQNKKIRNADFIYLDENTTVKTDALINGNGGKLITFASDTARIYGNLYSRGGSEGGNGGFIETSGLKGFEILNAPDVSASFGTGGSWLIDPYDLTIVSSGSGISPNGENKFTSASGDSNLNVNVLLNALNNGNVTLQTGANGLQAGKITVDAAINYQGNSSRTLTFLAGNGIDVNKNISSTQSQLNLDFNANSDNNSTGDFHIADGVSIASNGGNITISTVNFDAFTDNNDFGTISTYNDFGGGDITINATGNVDLGSVDFKYDYTRANSNNGNNTANLVRVGSVTINSGGNVTLNKEIDFNDTGKRQEDGDKGYAGTLLDGQDTFLKIEAFGDITIKQKIYDKDWGDSRDSLNIELTAGKNNTAGTINIDADIYTAGGNFSATSFDFDSTGFSVNTDRANERTTVAGDGKNGDARWSNGGNVTISARNTIKLGNITTDGSCDDPSPTACTGNLSLSGVDTDTVLAGMQSNVAVTQSGILTVAGDTTFNTGTGTITLDNIANNFAKDLIFTSAGNTSITDSSAIRLGTSSVTGNLKLTTGGNITQTGAVAVTGDAEFDAIASVTNYLIDLSLANDFGGKVKATKASSLKLVDTNDLSLDAITFVAGATAPNGTIDVTAGATNKIILNGNLNSAAATAKNIIFNSNVEVASNTIINAGTGAISFTGTTNSNDATAKNLTLTGGAITFTGNVGNLQKVGDFIINSTGVVTFANVTAKSFDVSTTNNFTGQNINTGGADSTLAAGEAGGDIVINAGSISLASVNASGGDSTAPGANAGGAAGNITLTANNSAVSKTITITGDVAAEGGVGSGAGANGAAGAVALTLSGNSIAGEVSLNSNSFLSSSLTVTGSTHSGDSLQLTNSNNDWSITSANTGTVKDSGNLVNSPVISFSGIENVTGGTGADNFVIGATGSVASISGGTGAGVNTLTGRDVNNTWEIGGNNQGVVKAGATTYAQFTNIQNLVGGSLNDYFDFSSVTTSAITGSIKGGAGEGAGVLNSLKGRNAASTWIITNLGAGSITGYLASFENIQNLTGGSAADTFNFSAANAAITGKVDGGAAAENNAIIARTGAPNTWKMTGNEKGSLEVTSPSSVYVNEFDHIQVFTGAGSDTMSFENFGAGTVKVTLGSTGSTGVTSFIGKDNVDAEIVKAGGINVWTITGANQGTIKETGFSDINFSKFNTLTGGTGKDTFDFSTVANSSISGVIDGGGAAEGNAIIARAGTGVKNTWSMTGNGAGKLEQTNGIPETYVGQFTDIQIFAGAGADTISYATVNTGTVEVTLGAAGVTGVTDFVGSALVDSTLIGENNNNAWIINGADSGSINFGAPGAITFSNFKNLSGGSQHDTFTFETAGSLSGTLNGQNGTDTLIAKDAANTWAFTAANIGNISVGGTTYLANFTGMQVLQGGSGIDTFNLSNNFDGTINGGAGNDVFNINAAVNILNGEAGNDRFIFSSAANAGTAANIDGGADANTLIGRIDNNTWTISSQNAGTLGITSGALYVTTFSNIQSLTGSTGVDIFNINAAMTGSINSGAGDNIFNINAVVGDLVGGANNDSFIFLNNGSANSVNGAGGVNTLVGKNRATTWAINLAESGSLTDDLLGTAYLNSFSNIQVLQGGTAVDTFSLNNVFSGLINGGSGADVFNINASVNELRGEDGNDRFVFGSSGSANSIDGAGGSNTLQAKDIANTWTLTADNQGVLASAGVNYVSSFSNIQTLQGGSDTDLFNLNFLFTGSIRGGAGNDTFAVNAQVNQLFGEDDNDSFIFSSANNQGSATLINGGAGVNSLTGRNAANTWTVSSLDAGSLGITNASAYVTSFTSIQTLNGGSDADTFVINANVSNGIFAGAGNNVFNVNTLVGSLTGGVDNDRFIFDATGSANSIDGGAGTNTLVGRNSANTWVLTAANTGSLRATTGTTYVSGFSNIQVLQGGNAVDTFDLKFAFSGTVNGGADNDIFNIEAVVNLLQGEDGNDSFLFSSDANTGTASTIDGGSGSNSLTGRNQDNTWTISGQNTGTLALTAGTNYVTEFKNIQTLNGGTGADNFIINATVNNAINAGAGDNTFTINADVGDISGGAGNDSFVFGESGRANSVSGGGGVNSLVGRNGLNTWEISGADQGRLRVTNGALYVNSFNDIQTLQGGSSVDIFNITNSYAGIIKGGAGDDSFNIFANANQLNGEAGNDSFTLIGQSSSVTTLDGGAGSNNLTGRNAANTWQITSANSGNLALTNGATYVSAFSNIQNIFGGTAVDIFQINAAIASINGGSGNDEFRINAAAGNLYGNDDDDQFIFSSADNAGSATLIDGGNGENRIVGRNTTNTWSITATNAGKVSVTGGPAYVSGFNNIQTLIGGNLADIFDINANVTNSINAGNGDNIFNIYTTVGDLLGGADNDQFAFGTSGRANSVNGGGGTNTLTARDADNRWTIVSSNAGNIATTSNDFYVNNFSNIQILNGGNAVDTFIIQSAAATIFGNEGNDVFEFANNGVASLIDGGVGTNTLKGRNQDTIWTMAGANSGNVATAATANIYVASFANIQNLTGGSGADTLVASNQANSWIIKQTNRGTLSATATPTAVIEFEGVENLLGNQGVDLFSFEANGYITGLIDGGSSATQNTIKDSLNLSAITGNLTIELGNQQTAALNVVNVEEITASTSNQDNHVLIGASDAAYRWRITGQNLGVVERAVDPLLETSVNFINFGDLRGGSNSDRFDVQGTVTKSIDGGSGIDLVDYSQRKENFVIVLGGSGGLGNTGINGIEGVVGNSASGNGFTSTIQVNSGDNIWEIGASSSFGDGINDGSITINNNKVSFENFTNLVGGSGNDTFKYIENGQWIGNIDGGGGNNIIDASLSIKDQQFIANGTALNAGTNLKNISRLIANTNTNSSLISTLQNNIWQIDNQGNGRLNSNLDFINIANLQGGSFVDVFSFANISWLKGIVDGGGGADTVNLLAIDKAIQVAVDAQTDADINLLNIETINANNNFLNTLKGDFNGNEWHINAANAGVLNKKINFTGFANLTGSAFADVVVFDNSAATLTGHLDLGDGQDILDLSASDRDITVQLNSSKAALASGVLSVDKIEVIKGDADQSNRLIGDNFTNTWTLDDVNAGRIAAAETGTITFTQFKHISGGNQDDLFVFEALGRVTGLVDGGGQAIRDNVDLSKSNNANVVITTTGESIGFTNVEKYIGNNVDSTLTAANIINNWSLTGANRGTLNDAIEFENFGVLKGGNKQDNFVINNATISGNIDSGDGDDTFDIRASAIAGKIKAGAGDDRFTFTIASGAEGTADIDGGEGANRLTVEGGDTDYKVSHQLGRHEYVSTAGSTYSILYSNVLNVFDNVLAKSLSIFGTTTADTFRLLTGRYNINNLSTVNYTNKSNLIVNGTADDQAIVDGTVGIESTVTFNNLRVLAENAGKIQAQSLELVNTGSVGSATARLNTAVNDISLSATNGAVYLNEQDALVFKNFNVSTTELVDIKAGSNLTSAGSLTYSGNLNLESLLGNIDLGNNNSLAGSVSLKAAGNVTLDNLQALSLGDLVAQNAVLSSSTSIKGLGVFSVAGLATLNAGNEISLMHAGNDINQITVARASKLDLFDSNGFTTVGLNVTNDTHLRSSGGIILSTSCTTDCNNTSGINTKNLKVQSDAAVTVAKNIVAADAINIESQGLTINDSITSKQFTLNALNGKLTLNDSGNLQGQEGTGIELTANNIEQRSKIVSGGTVKVNATGDVTMADAAVIESVNGDIVLTGNNLQLATLNASKGSTSVTAQGIVANKSITSRQISLNAGNGKITLNTDGNLLGQEGTGIELAANTIEQHSKIVSGGNLKVATTGDLTMFTSAEMESLNGNIVIDGNNLQLASLKSVNGSTTTTAKNAIKDGNGSAINIIATRWQADAVNGIGSGLGDAASADAIETNVDVLSVRNAGSLGSAQESNINIANNKALKIEQLANNGDIGISNLGDIILDNTNNSYFSPTNNDARTQGGVINSGANSVSGGQLLLTITGGMVRAENVADAKNPDIIANIATFKYNSSFDFGERNRKIVMQIPEVYNQNARLSFVKWYEGIKPKVMNDLSKVPSDSIISGRDQLIQIEGLSEIDPAIFTNLRNYVHDEVAILLPVDQRFDDSEDL